jgi:hypothetical protein
MRKKSADQDEVFWGQLKRSQHGIFIVQDGDSGPKNGL